MDKKKPDIDWLLVVLAIFDPDNDIFKKGYVPPKRQSPYSPEMPLFNNSDELITNLPLLSRKELLKGRGGLFLTKEQKLQAKLQAKTARLQAMQDSIAKQRAKLEELQNPKTETYEITLAEYEEFVRLRDGAANP